MEAENETEAADQKRRIAAIENYVRHVRSRIARMRGNGPYYVGNSWGPQPESYVSLTSNAKRAKAAIRGFDRAQRETYRYEASHYRVLRCVDRAAAERAFFADYGATPKGCEHVVEADL